jgi:hypothetical protein
MGIAGTTTVAWMMRGRTFADFERTLREFKQSHDYVPDDAEISTWESFGYIWFSVRWDGAREKARSVNSA